MQKSITKQPFSRFIQQTKGEIAINLSCFKFGWYFTSWLDLVHNVLQKSFIRDAIKLLYLEHLENALITKPTVSPVISGQINIYLSVFISTFLGWLSALKERHSRHFTINSQGLLEIVYNCVMLSTQHFYDGTQTQLLTRCFLDANTF